MPGLVHIKKEDHLGMDGTRSDGTARRKATSGLHICPVLPGLLESLLRSIQGCEDSSPSSSSSFILKICVDFHQGLTASRACEKSPIGRSASWQSDLGKPVVGAAAFFTEHVELLQSWVFPRPVSRTLYRSNKEENTNQR